MLNSLCQFWNDKSILLQILYPSSVSWKTIPLYFFSSNNIYFAQKEPIKVKIFETFECSGQNLSNSVSQFWNDELIPLQVLHHSSGSWKIVTTHNSSVDFKLVPFLLWIKGSHQNLNFETFNCSGENFPYSSCHFPNYNTVFLHIFLHPSVSWKITPLYFFRSNVILGQQILCTFFIVIVLNIFACSYCCILLVINFVCLLPQVMQSVFAVLPSTHDTCMAYFLL